MLTMDLWWSVQQLIFTPTSLVSRHANKNGHGKETESKNMKREREKKTLWVCDGDSSHGLSLFLSPFSLFLSDTKKHITFSSHHYSSSYY